MPRQVTAFACQHGCCRNVLTSFARMSAHETRCIFNPARQGCPSCKHGRWVQDGDDCRTWSYRDCEHIPQDKQCVMECAHWEPMP